VNHRIFERKWRSRETPGACLSESLAAFTSPVNGRHEEFDPKVIYDPQHNRFVLVCLVGFVDSTSKIIVGFSQSADPNGAWNLYVLPGNPLNNSLWTDYPMLSLSKKRTFYYS